MEIKTLIPLLAPFITIFLGFISIPFIEAFKNSIERKRLLKSLDVELQDQILIINREFGMLYICFENIMKALNEKSGAGSIKTALPEHLKIYSIDKLLENHFELVAPNIRRSIKNLSESIAHLNNLADHIDNHYNITLPKMFDDKFQTGRLISFQGNYLMNILYYRYNIQYLLKVLANEKTDLKIFNEIEFNEAIRNQLVDMNREDCISKLVEA